MLAAEADSTPCRWAVARNLVSDVDGSDDGSEPPMQLVDLTPHAQVSRGQELLRLLREPVTPSKVASSSPAPDLSQPDECMDVEVRVRNTFIELVRSPPQRALKRSRSEPAILGLASCDDFWIQLQDRHSRFDTSVNDAYCQEIADKGLDSSTHCALPSQKENRWLSLDACIDSSCGKVGEQHFFSLSACISETRHYNNFDVSPELSDASTDTPRESIEDFSTCDMLDGTSFGEVMLVDGAENFGHFYAAASNTYCDEDAWNYLPTGAGNTMTQQSAPCPDIQYNTACMVDEHQLPCATVGLKAWPSPSEWSATFHSQGAPWCA